MDSTVQPAKHAVKLNSLEKLPLNALATLSDGRRGPHTSLGHDGYPDRSYFPQLYG